MTQSSNISLLIGSANQSLGGEDEATRMDISDPARAPQQEGNGAQEALSEPPRYV